MLTTGSPYLDLLLFGLSMVALAGLLTWDRERQG